VEIKSLMAHFPAQVNNKRTCSGVHRWVRLQVLGEPSEGTVGMEWGWGWMGFKWREGERKRKESQMHTLDLSFLLTQ
jgi:hypothetical protein